MILFRGTIVFIRKLIYYSKGRNQELKATINKYTSETNKKQKWVKEHSERGQPQNVLSSKSCLKELQNSSDLLSISTKSEGFTLFHLFMGCCCCYKEMLRCSLILSSSHKKLLKLNRLFSKSKSLRS